MSDSVRYSFEDAIAFAQLDDGKVNALSPAVLEGLQGALDQAAKDEARAFVLAGREGRFSAGFDLSVMNDGPEKALAMVTKGAEFAIRILEAPHPVVFAVTGHALAMGAVLTCAADERIGAEGPFKIGLNEVAIGMTLPAFAIDLARDRLSKRHVYRATVAAEIYGPEGARDAGYLDDVVPAADVVSAARARAKHMAETLDPRAYRGTKRAMRRGLIAQLREGLESRPPRFGK